MRRAVAGSDGRPWSRCIGMVERATEFAGTRLNFVPTNVSERIPVIDILCALQPNLHSIPT